MDEITPGGSFDAVTAALSAVGLGSVPSWLRPYAALSTGEKFRADLARVLCERPGLFVMGQMLARIEAMLKASFIRPGAQVGRPVTLGVPVLKARIANAEYGQSRARLSEGGSFEWTQTLR